MQNIQLQFSRAIYIFVIFQFAQQQSAAATIASDSGSEHEVFNADVRDCHHDEIGFKLSIESMSGINQLQVGADAQSNYLQLRFMNEMNFNTSTKEGYNLNQYVIRLLNSATSFFKQFLTLKRRSTGKLRFPIDIEQCQFYTVDQKYKTDDTDDAHIIIFATKEVYPDITQKSFVWAAPCLHNSDGTLFAQINFDQDELLTTNFSDFRFAIDLQSVMHQIIHILGFSSTIYTSWSGGMFDNNNMVLNTANVQSTTKDYYNLDQLTGMVLEDTLQKGGFSSHWKQISLKGEIMNQFFEPQPNISISEFTTSLLEDTNWYHIPLTSINYIVKLSWGKKAGIAFLYQSKICQDGSRNEFCGINNASDVQKGFANEGFGTCETKDYTSQCKVYDVRNIDICWNPFNSKDLDNKNLYSTSQSFSWKSKVFESNYEKQSQSNSQKNFRCFEYECEQSQNGDWYSISITIDDGIKALCTIIDQDQSLDIQQASTNSLKYWIKCPSSISNFCSHYQQCPQFCSQKGICINGRCVCLETNNKMETQLDSSSTCAVLNCDTGFFDAKLQKCMDCSLNCAKCEYSRDICTECAEDYYMDSNGLCRGQCTKGWYGDTNTKMCLRCSPNCSECSNTAIECTACYDSYKIQNYVCVKSSSNPDDGTDPNNNNNQNTFAGNKINYQTISIILFITGQLLLG